MKAFILAAGRGTRISRWIEDVPKCTLPIDGVPLIRRTVSLLIEEGFEIVVCVGYQAEKIYKSLNGLAVKYYHNPFHGITNSIASLWFAKDEIQDDMIILNGDVYFTKLTLNRMLHNNHEVCMAIDKSRTEVGDYFFSTTEIGCIQGYGKELPLAARSCEYVGLAKIKQSFASNFVERLNSLVSSGQYTLWWENVLYSFTNNGEKNIYTVDVEGDFWAEIDYFDDYERIIQYIEKEKAKNDGQA